MLLLVFVVRLRYCVICALILGICRLIHVFWSLYNNLCLADHGVSGSRSLHLHGSLLAGDNFLRSGRGTHLLLLFQKLEFGQVLMKLFQSLILFGFLLNSHLVPFLNDSILGFMVVHKGVAYLALRRTLPQQAHRMCDLSSLVLREQENLVCTFNEYLLFGP